VSVYLVGERFLLIIQVCNREEKVVRTAQAEKLTRLKQLRLCSSHDCSHLKTIQGQTKNGKVDVLDAKKLSTRSIQTLAKVRVGVRNVQDW
jgi:hypothetical protein